MTTSDQPTTVSPRDNSQRANRQGEPRGPERNPARQPMPIAHGDVALCDMRDVCGLTRMSPSWINQQIKDGKFPAPVIREPRCSRWLLSSIREWIIARTSPTDVAAEVAAKVVAKATKASAAAQAKRCATSIAATR